MTIILAMIAIALAILAFALAILSTRINNVEAELKQALKFGSDNADDIKALKERSGVWPSTPPRAVQTIVPDPGIWSKDL